MIGATCSKSPVRPAETVMTMLTGPIRAFASLALLVLAMAVMPFPAKAIDIQRVVSPGGIEAWLVEDRTVPLITVNFAFRGGASQDPADRPGVANLLSAVLDEGAGDLDAEAFRTRVDELAMRLGFSAGRDTFSGEMRTLEDVRADAFEMLRLAINEPRLDTEAVERMRARILAGARGNLTDPGTLAGRAWSEAVFGDHPYARPVAGTVDSIPEITIDDLEAFHGRVLARDNLVVAVVGAIEAEELATRLDKVFGALPESADLAPVSEPDLPEAFQSHISIDVPQTIIQYGRPGILRDDPDFIPAFIANHILGGGSFTSRLYREVREERGLVYSVYSALFPLDHAGLVIGNAATGAARAGQTVDVVREVIARFAEEGPTDAEIEAAKNFLKGSYALRFDTSDKIAGQLLGIQIDGLGIDYIDTRNDLIDAVTPEEVREAARRVYGDGGLWIVTAGQDATDG